MKDKDEIRKQIEKLESEMNNFDFWNDKIKKFFIIVIILIIIINVGFIM
jgi:hypothetical protein